MIGLTLLFIAIPVSVFIFLWLFRVKSKKVLLGIPIFIFCLPFIFAGGLYLLRTPIQQGKFLSDFGPLLCWVFPPEDLYDPLAEETLSPDKVTYIFNISHKYVGRHAVFIEIPTKKQPGRVVENNLRLSTEISDGNNDPFVGSSERGSPYFGRDKYGYYYVGYKVPENVPVAKEATVQIEIGKGINDFLKRHKTAKIVIRKMSDQ